MPIRYFSILFLSTISWAQSPGHTVVRGELQIEGHEGGHDYQVDLASCAGGSSVIHALMSGGYRFEFHGIEPGCKMLRVLSGPGRAIIQEEQVLVEGPGMPLVVRVQKTEKEPIKAATVSVNRLRNPLQREVVRAIEEANRLWQAGRVIEAGEELRPVIAKYPDVWELQLNFGLIEAKLGNTTVAVEHFSRARALEPRSPAAALDLGFALFQLKRWEEAESAAKDAVALDPNSEKARMLLARVRSTRERMVSPHGTN